MAILEGTQEISEKKKIEEREESSRKLLQALGTSAILNVSQFCFIISTRYDYSSMVNFST